MNSREKAEIYLTYLRAKYGPPFLNDSLDIDGLEFAFDEHAAEVIREALASWMIKRGYATGHGDTTEDLLEVLREQIGEKNEN